MESSELLSGHLAWWLAGGALVLLLLVVPRLRRGRQRDVKAVSTGRLSSLSGGEDAGPGSADESIVTPSAPSPDAASVAGAAPDPSAAADGEADMDNAMRLEVARVYMELEDAAGAEAMLRQVIAHGDEGEREAAQTLQQRLDGQGGASAGDGPPRNAENLLDLATAYVEIGDAEMARLTVAQIEAVGTETQRRQARDLLDRLAD